MNTIKKQTKTNVFFSVSYKHDVDVFFNLIKDRHKNHEKIITDIYSKAKIFFNKDNNSISKKYIIDFVKLEYSLQQKKIEKNVRTIEKAWQKVEEDFFLNCTKIFKNYNNGLVTRYYKAYPSIWAKYIRNTKDKSVTFPYDKGVDDALFVISHEILHIIFYNYLYSKYPVLRRQISSQRVYDSSEVINVILQNNAIFIKIFHLKAKAYPEHKELYRRVKKLWQEKKDIDFVIKNILL